MNLVDFSHFKRLLPVGNYARNVGTMLGGNLIVQIIVLVTYPILTRMYSPHEYGLASLFAMMITVPATISSLKYEMAIPLPEELRSASEILIVSLIWLLMTTFVLAAATPFIGYSLLSSWDAEELLAYLWLIPVGILGFGLYQILTYWAMRIKDFKSLAQTLVSRTAMETGIQLGAGFLHPGTLGLVIGTLMGNLAGNIKLCVTAWNNIKENKPEVSCSMFRRVSKRYSRFPIFTGTATLMNTLAGRIAIPFLAAMFGDSVVGWFSLATMALDAPSAVIRNAVWRVYYPEAAVLFKKNPIALRALYLRSARRLSILSVIPMFLALFIAPEAAKIFFGKSWAQTGIYVQYLVPAIFLRTIAVPLSNFSILERQELGLIWNILWITIIAGTLWIAKLLELGVHLTIALHSASMCVGYILMFTMSLQAITVASHKQMQDIGANNND